MRRIVWNHNTIIQINIAPTSGKNQIDYLVNSRRIGSDQETGNDI